VAGVHGGLVFPCSSRRLESIGARDTRQRSSWQHDASARRFDALLARAVKALP
jgi:hypothetical protein